VTVTGLLHHSPWCDRRFRLLALALLLLVTACESDVHRAERLRTEELRQCLAVLTAESSGDWSHVTDSSRAECDVARRNYARFMAGR
jgi:hypothetical protein